MSSNNLTGTVELDTLLRKPKTSYELYLSSNKLSLVTNNTAHPSSSRFFASIGFRSCDLSEFPSFLHNQNELVSLDLSSNHMSGKIPGWLLDVCSANLKYLNLSHNVLTGFDQQAGLNTWNALLTLDLTYNKFHGSLPIPLQSINYYLISHNYFRGNFPSWVCDLDRLQVLDLPNNNLTDVLPQCLFNFSDDLAVLELENNKFRGTIPQTFMEGTQLKMIDLSRNLLEGKIPRSIANCTRLEFLNLGDNQLTDIFPFWLGTLSELEVLVLQSNRLYGVVKEPENDFEFPKLRIIDLSHNRFVGQLLSKYFLCWNAMKAINASQLTYMQDLLNLQSSNAMGTGNTFVYSLTLSNKGQGMKYERISNMLIGILLSNNGFTGEIPISIANLKGLQNLNLSNNNLSGQIPSSLGNLRALESFDISNNMFSGEIPQQLAELTALAYFSVSYNHLRGPIPKGTQFDTFPNSSFEGNPGLCGRHLSKKCSTKAPEKEDLGSCKSPFEFDWRIALLIGYAGGIIAGVALGHVFVSAGKHELFLMIFERLLRRIKRKQN